MRHLKRMQSEAEAFHTEGRSILWRIWVTGFPLLLVINILSAVMSLTYLA